MYTRAGCHLCEEAKALMEPLLGEFGAELREVDIDKDPAMRAQYDYDVPVIFLGDKIVAKHRVDMEQLRRQLARARNS
jgi:glutaredoxin